MRKFIHHTLALTLVAGIVMPDFGIEGTGGIGPGGADNGANYL